MTRLGGLHQRKVPVLQLQLARYDRFQDDAILEIELCIMDFEGSIISYRTDR